MSDETKNTLIGYLNIIEKELNTTKNARDDYEPLVGDDQGLDYLGSEFTGP